jgi:dienelactone hydrolase
MKDKIHLKIVARHIVVAFLIVLLSGTLNILNADFVVTLNRSDRDTASCSTTGDPIMQRYILIEVPDAIATLVLFVGGHGKINVTSCIRTVNFLYRTRHLFGGHMFNVAVMDAATDFLSCPYGLINERLSTEHVSDIDAVIQDLRTRFPEKEVLVVGTSRGTISAAQAAAALPQMLGGPDGLVLTSSVTRESSNTAKDTVLDVELEEITIPTLIVYHVGDQCYVTPPDDTYLIKNRLLSASKIAVKRIRGELYPLTDECNPLSNHGYFGDENLAVETIAAWISKNLNHW